MGGPRMNESQYDNVIMLRSKGLQLKEVAGVMGISETQVKIVSSIHNAAATGDTDMLLRRQKSHGSVVTWACRKYGVSLGDSVKPEESAASKPDNTALAFVQLAESLRALTSAVQAIDQRLSAMQMTQAGFRSDAAEQAKKIIEAVNINGDILTKENERMIDLMAGIKCNTRKRGSGNDAV